MAVRELPTEDSAFTYCFVNKSVYLFRRDTVVGNLPPVRHNYDEKGGSGRALILDVPHRSILQSSVTQPKYEMQHQAGSSGAVQG